MPDSGRASPHANCARRFRSEQRGAATIVTAIAFSFVVVALGGVMEIVNTAYATDRMGRAARAAARVLAIDASADWCAAIRSELRLDEGFVCANAWTVDVDLGVAPEALPDPLSGAVGGEGGELVLVRIGWTTPRWSFLSPASPALFTRRVAFGLARSEPAG